MWSRLPIVAIVFCCLCGGCALAPYPYGGKYFTELDPALQPGEPQFERGRPAPILDAVGWLFGLPRRVLVLSPRMSNHNVSPETEAKLGEYLAKNGLDKVKVRINEYDPSGEWERLKANESINKPLRYTIGPLYMTAYTLFPGRVWGGDDFSLWTNTIHIYSDVPAQAIYEGALAKEYAKRKYKWLGSGSFQAARDALGYIQENGTPDELKSGYRTLYPSITFHTFPLFTNFTLPVLGASHVAGQAMALSVKEDSARQNPKTDAAAHGLSPEVVRLPSTSGTILPTAAWEDATAEENHLVLPPPPPDRDINAARPAIRVE